MRSRYRNVAHSTSARLILLVTALYLAGCSPIPKKALEKPEVFVKNVYPTQIGARSAEIEIRLSVRNTNDVELTLLGIDYNLSLNGRPVLAGDSKKEVVLPPYGTGEIPLRATFEYERVFSSISEALRKRRVVYQLNGSAGIGPFRIPFVSGGEFVLE